eukprot:gene17439-22991_t
MDIAKLSQVESLCQALYQGSNAQLRLEAQQQLLTLQSSADFIPQCQFILDNSKQSYAQLVASSSLESLITQFWNNFTVEQKVEIRNYILNYLATHATNMEDFVIGSVTKLVCRITKLGWFDSPEHRHIIEAITRFLEATIDHYLIGLRILGSLVDEMNTQTVGRTVTMHRKTAVSFRDQTLLEAFQIAITSLKSLQSGVFSGLTPKQEEKMGHAALYLANLCLSFDFIGTNPEESSEDVGTVQVPSSWRPLIQDISTMQLFFDYYARTNPPRSSIALQALVQLSSVRRSLFASEKERVVFLQALMTGIQLIVQKKIGLDHEENYHEFCRLLGRLKASYQLSELVKINGFVEWLELACDFTMRSLQNWQYSMNSVHYLLALWGRMVAALPYLRAEASDSQRQAQTLRQCVLRVTESYIKTMLDSVDIVVTSEGGIDDPLEDEGSLKEQMDRLPVIAHMQYETVAAYLLNLFEQALTLYDQALALAVTPQVNQHMTIVEGKFTWLTYMVATIIGTQTSPDPKKPGEDLIWDSRLCRCVFQLIQVIDFRLTRTSGSSKCDGKLEIAILNFFKSFKKSFIIDGLSSVPLSLGAVVPGGVTPHPLLSFALSYSGEKETNTEVGTIYDAMGIGDMNTVMNAVVNKLCNNIKFWHRNDDLRQPSIRIALIGALRDLRGITVSTYNKRTYNLLFDSLYPHAFVLFNRIAEVWYDDANVMTALLKFLQEFVLNKAQRITFEQSSANGILLFRETSNILCTYGSRILQIPVIKDVYIEKYKGIRNHLDVLCGLDSNVFLQLLKTNQDGLQSSDQSICAMCSSTIDHLATYIFLNRSREKSTIQLIRQHISSDPEVLNDIMASLFNALLFSSQVNQWAITRPILSLLLAAESTYTNYQNQLINTQNIENQEKLKEEFEKLGTDIQQSVESTNRDKFTQKLTVFRLNVRNFLTL